MLVNLRGISVKPLIIIFFIVFQILFPLFSTTQRVTLVVSVARYLPLSAIWHDISSACVQT